MSLVLCPDCRQQHSDRAPACIHCGRPNDALAVAHRPAAPVVPIAPGPKSAHACPRCGSEETYRLPMLWQAGTAITQSQTTGLIYAGGGLGVATAGTSGTSRSALAMNAAPPQRKSQGSGALLMGLVLGGGIAVVVAIAVALRVGGEVGPSIGMLAGLLVLICSLVLAIRPRPAVTHWNQTEYPRLLAWWEATFQCMRCGERFVPPGTQLPGEPEMMRR